MDELLCFAAVEFPDDPNVAGNCYWYLCPFEEAAEGDKVTAPLGRHNGLQCGVVRKVLFAHEWEPPYPLYLIKSIQKLHK